MNPWDNDQILASYRAAIARCTDADEKTKLSREANKYLMDNYTEQPMLLSTELFSPTRPQAGVAQGTLF